VTRITLIAAAAAAAALAGQAIAAPPPDTVKPAPPAATTPPPAGQPTMPPSQPTDLHPNAAVAPGLKVGMPVKDNTGAAIGTVSEMKPEANGSGRMFATVKMSGTEAFSVDASSLQVQGDSAVINMTQAQIVAMIHPPQG
jgi:hypothetical protein